MCTAVIDKPNLEELDQLSHGLTSAGVDPLRSTMPLPYQNIFFPYGFPALLKSNDLKIIQTAEACWNSHGNRFRVPPIEMRFVRSENYGRRTPPVPTFRAQATILTMIADANNFGCCDLAASFGFAFVTGAAVANRDYLRYHFLESMAYSLLDTRYVAMIHAACVGRGGHGILLAGESGSGKSSLAYACARRGWTYISDDASAIVLHGGGRTVVGNPHRFRFRPHAKLLFPELQGRLKTRNGKPTLEVKTEHWSHLKTAYEYNIDNVVFLNRNKARDSSAQLTPISSEQSLEHLLQNPWPRELPIHADRLSALERMAATPCYELTYQEFDSAIDLLDSLVTF
jgi:hypothetical protein